MYKYKKLIIKIIFVVAVVGLAFYIGKIANSSETIQSITLRYGYTGIFLLSVVSGFNILVPIPVISFLPLFIESGLSFWITVLIISFGLTMGDVLGFLIGTIGRDALSMKSKIIIEKLEVLKTKSHNIPLVVMFFYASLVPFPNEVLVIPLAFMGYRIGAILPIVLAGNILFNIVFGQTAIAIFDFL